MSTCYDNTEVPQKGHGTLPLQLPAGGMLNVYWHHDPCDALHGFPQPALSHLKHVKDGTVRSTLQNHNIFHQPEMC